MSDSGSDSIQGRRQSKRIRKGMRQALHDESDQDYEDGYEEVGGAYIQEESEDSGSSQELEAPVFGFAKNSLAGEDNDGLGLQDDSIEVEMLEKECLADETKAKIEQINNPEPPQRRAAAEPLYGRAEDEDRRNKRYINQIAGQVSHKHLDSEFKRQASEKLKEKSDERKETAQKESDERIPGNFNNYDPRLIRGISGLGSKAKPGHKDRHQPVICLVAWWPSQDDPQMIPLDTEEDYADVRKKAPKLLVEYFQKRTRFV